MKIFPILAIALGGYISLVNWICFFRSLANRDKESHPILPIFGALFLGLGLACFKTTKSYAFFSIIADYGTLALILSIPFLLKEAWKTSRFNLVKKFVGKTAIARYELRLYKYDNFVLEVNYDPPQASGDGHSRIISSGMVGEWYDINGLIEFKEQYGKCFKLVPANGHYRLEEPAYPKDQKFSYDCLDGIDFTLQNARQN